MELTIKSLEVLKENKEKLKQIKNRLDFNYKHGLNNSWITSELKSEQKRLRKENWSIKKGYKIF